ncbi:MAG: GNAT family N-acetyltransferase, partial [Anaerolineae bacterium]|nr:GNAT family N-acetyltransferase [Anaerolineae bacterium]
MISPSQTDTVIPATPSTRETRPACDLIPASEYTLEELTDAYNRARSDYIVPMPMNVARMQAYIDSYDLSLERSVVASNSGDVVGLAMLGVRPDHTWITRLGVIPNKRRVGAGRSMMTYEIDQSRDLGVDHIMLEVIKNNVPAHTLFCSLGFTETRELLILRRPPGLPTGEAPIYAVKYGGEARALELLSQRESRPSWLDEYSSLENAGDLACLEVALPDGSRGWLTYQVTVFQLGRLVLQTEVGDPASVAAALAHALHTRYPEK